MTDSVRQNQLHWKICTLERIFFLLNKTQHLIMEDYAKLLLWKTARKWELLFHSFKSIFMSA